MVFIHTIFLQVVEYNVVISSNEDITQTYYVYILIDLKLK